MSYKNQATYKAETSARREDIVVFLKNSSDCKASKKVLSKSFKEPVQLMNDLRHLVNTGQVVRSTQEKGVYLLCIDGNFTPVKARKPALQLKESIILSPVNKVFIDKFKSLEGKQTSDGMLNAIIDKYRNELASLVCPDLL